MPFVIRIIHYAAGGAFSVGGERTFPGHANYIREFDASGEAGRGLLNVTLSAHEALTFTTFEEAVAYWQQPHGTRSDGEPSRPLTAYTVAVLDQEAAAAEDATEVRRCRHGEQ